MYSVCRYDDASAFLRVAESWLLQEEAANNLILGIAGRLVREPDAWGAPVYLATVHFGPDVVGCAYRTGSHKLVLTDMPIEAVDSLVNDVAGFCDMLPAVLGPNALSQAFAEQWCRLQGCSARIGMRQRIYAATSVDPTVERPDGNFRLARPDESDFFADWLHRFEEDAHVGVASGRSGVDRWIKLGRLAVWEHNQPVSMAVEVGQTPNGARVGGVFTPRPFRGSGYATACVHRLTQQLLERGLAFCFLYTDLANPTSNAIYTRIGYRPVMDVSDWGIDVMG